MKLSAHIEFWDEGITCFCHEAIGRALQKQFTEIQIDDLDLAHQKYLSVVNSNENLASSAWTEFLRNGPRFRFALPSGVFGYFCRYSVEFEIPATTGSEEFSAIKSFLKSLTVRGIIIEESS